MSNFASGYIKYINHLEQINQGAVDCPERMIREVEGSYQGHLRSIAQDIVEHHGGAMVLMLSGPSSSGKTSPSWGRPGTSSPWTTFTWAGARRPSSPTAATTTSR